MTEAIPDIFKRHIGTWQGEYIKTNAKGHFLRSFKGTFTVMIEGITYRQVNDYEYADGSTLTLNFAGQFESGILRMESSSYDNFKAIAWDAGYNIIGFKVDKIQDGSLISFMEMINLVSDNYRVRSTQEFKDHQFVGTNFIEEIKV